MLAGGFLNSNSAANSTARQSTLFEHVCATRVTQTIQVVWYMTTFVSVRGAPTARTGSRLQNQELTGESGRTEGSWTVGLSGRIALEVHAHTGCNGVQVCAAEFKPSCCRTCINWLCMADPFFESY